MLQCLSLLAYPVYARPRIGFDPGAGALEN
jgi:hypothetical protein